MKRGFLSEEWAEDPTTWEAEVPSTARRGDESGNMLWNCRGDEPSAEPVIRECRVCGCSDFDACFDPDTGAGCYWVDEDLCSVCGRDHADVGELFG